MTTLKPNEPYINTRLSKQARDALREIITREAGIETAEEMGDVGIDHYGLFLLALAVEGLKMKKNGERNEAAPIIKATLKAHSISEMR